MTEKSGNGGRIKLPKSLIFSLNPYPKERGDEFFILSLGFCLIFLMKRLWFRAS